MNQSVQCTHVLVQILSTAWSCLITILSVFIQMVFVLTFTTLLVYSAMKTCIHSC